MDASLTAVPETVQYHCEASVPVPAGSEMISHQSKHLTTEYNFDYNHSSATLTVGEIRVFSVAAQ